MAMTAGARNLGHRAAVAREAAAAAEAAREAAARAEAARAEAARAEAGSVAEEASRAREGGGFCAVGKSGGAGQLAPSAISCSLGGSRGTSRKGASRSSSSICGARSRHVRWFYGSVDLVPEPFVIRVCARVRSSVRGRAKRRVKTGCVPSERCRRLCVCIRLSSEWRACRQCGKESSAAYSGRRQYSR